jgi:hypothetical protein
LCLERGGRVQPRPFFIEQGDRDDLNKLERLVHPPLPSRPSGKSITEIPPEV